MADMKTLKETLLSGGYDSVLKEVYLYDDCLAQQRKRYADVIDSFINLFGADRIGGLYSAPGRTEIGGNHTDHNHGRVLAAGIDLDAIAVASKNTDHTVRVKSEGYRMDVVDLSDLSVQEKETGHSAALVRGVCARFQQLGYRIGGFDATTASRVPAKIQELGHKVGGFDAWATSSVLSGSGLSSSAAYEVLVGNIVNHFFCEGALTPIQIAKIGQYAENVYFGKPCGLLDQMASSVSGFVMIDFKDPSAPVIEKVDFDFASCGHSLCIVDTGGNHSDLTEEYAAVRGEMEAVAAEFQKPVLREVEEETFRQGIPTLRNRVGDRAILRALHFYCENKRVIEEVEALRSGDFETFKEKVIESGQSSFMYNQNVYTPRLPKEQPIALALQLTEQMLRGKGAWRVHGGGFAGTIQAFVPNDCLAEYQAEMERIFGVNTCYVLSVRPVGGVQIAEE